MVHQNSAKTWKWSNGLYPSSTPTLVLCLSFSAEEERLQCNKGIRSRSDQYPLLAPTPKRLSCSRNTVTLCHIFLLQYIISPGTLEGLIDRRFSTFYQRQIETWCCRRESQTPYSRIWHDILIMKTFPNILRWSYIHEEPASTYWYKYFLAKKLWKVTVMLIPLMLEPLWIEDSDTRLFPPYFPLENLNFCQISKSLEKFTYWGEGCGVWLGVLPFQNITKYNSLLFRKRSNSKIEV